MDQTPLPSKSRRKSKKNGVLSEKMIKQIKHIKHIKHYKTLKDPKMSKRLKYLEHRRITQSHPYELYFSRCFGKDTHACRCIDCEPSVQDNMFAEPYHFVKGQEEEFLSKEVADTLELQFQQELRSMARGHAQKEAYERSMIRRNRKKKHKLRKRLKNKPKPNSRPNFVPGLHPSFIKRSKIKSAN